MSSFDLRFGDSHRKPAVPSSQNAPQSSPHAPQLSPHALQYFSVGVSLPATAWWMMLICSSIALVSSSYLAWSSLTSSPVAGCSGGKWFDCGHVLHSKWSSVMSVPVSVPAIAVHVSLLSMLLAGSAAPRWQSMRWSILGFASLSSGAAALWFVGLQVFVLEHLCKYCLIAHACGLVLAGIFLWKRPLHATNLFWIGGAVTLSIAMLIVLQTLNATPQTFELIDHSKTNGVAVPLEDEEESLFEAPKPPNEPQALLRRDPFSPGFDNARIALAMPWTLASLLGGQVANVIDGGVEVGKVPKVRSARILNNLKLDTTSWPLIGKPDAELVFVEMFDYTCEHCQRTHKALEGARKKLGDRLAIIALPVPLDIKCNPTVKVTDAAHMESCDLAKLAIAVWSVDRDKFSEFHSYLFVTKPKYAQALLKANEMVDAAKLKQTLGSSLPGEYVAKHISLYQKAGAGTIPKLMFPQTTSVGAIESADTIVRLIEQHLR